MCPPGFGSAIFRRQIVQRRISSGPVGAIIAGICYQFIGAASYLLAAILLGFGAAKLFYPGLRFAPRLAWIVLFIISGACLLHVQPYHLQGWHAAFNIQGPGGWIGYAFADQHRGLLRNALGPLGTLLLLTGIYVTTLILVTGLRPIHLVRETVAAYATHECKAAGVAIAPQAAQIGSQGKTGDQ